MGIRVPISHLMENPLKDLLGLSEFPYKEVEGHPRKYIYFLPFMTSAPLTAASNSYMVKVGGQSTILSPGSSTHLQCKANNT